MNTCLFCDLERDNQTVGPNKDYICGACTMLLMSVDQEKLQKAYALAVQKGKARKAEAIETFLKEVRYVGTGTEAQERDGSADRGNDDGVRAGEGVRGAGIDREAAAVRG